MSGEVIHVNGLFMLVQAGPSTSKLLSQMPSWQMFRSSENALILLRTMSCRDSAVAISTRSSAVVVHHNSRNLEEKACLILHIVCLLFRHKAKSNADIIIVSTVV